MVSVVSAQLTSAWGLSACVDRSEEDREAEQRSLREERARRARAERARQDFHRRWHEQYRQEIQRATGRHGATPSTSTPSTSTPSTSTPLTLPLMPLMPDLVLPPLPQGPQPTSRCDPWAELEERTRSARHLSAFRKAVRLVLGHTKAGLVSLDGRPHQRFLFALRMHPGEEPALGRRPSRGNLTLKLRWVPLCQPDPAVISTQTLRFRLQRQRSASHGGLQLRLPGRITKPVVPGMPVELLLDPTVSSLSRVMSPAGRRAPSLTGTRPMAGSSDLFSSVSSSSVSSSVVGLWEITDARIPDRPRTMRLDLDTSAFGHRLRQIALVEVPCPAHGGRCRFLTRAERQRETALELPALLRLAAPLTREAEIRQLWALMRALKFPRCSSGGVRRSASGHPCLTNRGLADTEPCQYWLALHGHNRPLRLRQAGSTFHARQVLSCPGRRHRILSLEATFQKNGDLQLRETNLANRVADLEAELERMTR